MALCLVVLTGFAALAIDAGMGYDRSRNDQDVADAAALAAAYWVNYNASSGDNLSGAYTAAKNVADINCTNTAAPCTTNFNLTVYSAYGTTKTVVTNVGVTNGTVGCSSSATGPFTGACPVVSGTDTYVGANISDTASEDFANLGQSGSRTYAVGATAVSQVAGSGLQVLQCQLCVLGSGGISFNGAGTCWLISGGNGSNICPTVTTDNGADVYINYNFNLSCSGGFLCLFGTDSYFTTPGTDTYIGGSVNQSDGTANFSPAAKTGATKISDPLASMPLPSLTGGTNCGSISGTSETSPCATWPKGKGNSPLDLTPGDYGTLSLTGGYFSGMTVNFAAGTYIFAGGSTAGIQATDGNLTLNGTGVTLYFTCGTSAAPAACASGADGATYDEDSATLSQNLSAPTSGPQENLLFIFDRNNASTISEDDWFEFLNDSGALYAPAATYYSDALWVGNAIASPVVIGSMNISGYGFSMDGDPVVPGGPGGLVK